jgi:hypothetical protein
MSVGKTARKGLSPANVVATGQATASISVGKTLNNLQLQLGGTALTKAMIPMLRLKANAKTIFEGSATQIEAMNAYRGLTSNAAFLDVAFEDLSGLDQIDRMIGALDTSRGIADLTYDIDIAGATAPIIAPRLIESAPQRQADGSPSPFAGLMCKTLRYGFAAAAAGELPLTNFPFGPKNGAVIKRVHFFTNGGLMTGIVVKEDGLIVHESLKAQNEYEQVRHDRVPQANCYTVDFILDGNVRNAFDTRKAQSVEWIPTFSGAEAGFILIEYLDTLGNL